eukprot:10973778-Alexandrium_andersonii.AAC.1
MHPQGHEVRGGVRQGRLGVNPELADPPARVIAGHLAVVAHGPQVVLGVLPVARINAAVVREDVEEH